MSWRDTVGRWFARSTPTQAQASPQPVNSRLALPSPDPRSEPPANLGDTGEKLIGQVHEAARNAGMQPDDPMMPLVTAITDMARGLYARIRESDRIADHASRRTVDAIERARLSADAETRRFRAELASTEADLISRVGSAIARTADDAFTRRVRVLDRNSILVATAVLVGTGVTCLGGGYWWGGSNARTDIHETELGLQAAFSNGSEDAKIWLGLMTWNDVGVALHACSKPGASAVQDGRRGCVVPLWIEAAPPSVPSTQQ